MKDLLITLGDPHGIGYEVAAKFLLENSEYRSKVTLVCDRWILEETFKKILKVCMPSDFDILDICNNRFLLEYGKLSKEAGAASMRYIEAAVENILQGNAKAIITCPINKKSINDAGFHFPGHTEFLEALARKGTDKEINVSMMLVSPNIKMVLTTTHYSIKDVASKIDAKALDIAIKNTFEAGRYFNKMNPKIAMAGLNPHAGDGGVLGDEEELFIKPAIERARLKGIDIHGPFPADSLFADHKRWNFIIAQYHDQGMIPVKLDGFGNAVNVTLGLPFIRTSVDHGTAFDIAGKGIASYSSLAEAIKLAEKMVHSNESN